MPNVADAIREKLTALLEALESELDADVIGLFGPILGGLEHQTRAAIESLGARRKKLVVVLHTVGGSIEVTERLVDVLRHHYNEVAFLVPDVALSAGTILAMSGDAIMMDYFACLGPIDPQVERDGKLVPALSYLEQYDRLVTKSQQGALTTAELALLTKLDLAELHSFEQARELTIDLLVEWLAKYKFKDWQQSQSRKVPVTQDMREGRAREIAHSLNDHRRWRSHGRGIPMRVLQSELKLRVDDFGANPELAHAVREYYSFCLNCMSREGFTTFVTSRGYV
jgi:hypothetical protein